MNYIVCTPVGKHYKHHQDKDSRRDYEDQLKQPLSMRWDDSDRNDAQVGDFFAFVFNGIRVRLHKIVDVVDPAERPLLWKNNSGHDKRNVLVLSALIEDLSWEEWIEFGGIKRSYGTRRYFLQTRPLLDIHLCNF